MKYLLVVGLTLSMLNVPVTLGERQDHADANPPVQEIERPFWKFWAKDKEVVKERAHIDVEEFRKLQGEDIQLLLNFLEKKREEVKEIEAAIEKRKNNRYWAYGASLLAIGAGLAIVRLTMHVDEIPTSMGNTSEVVGHRLRAMKSGFIGGSALATLGAGYLGHRGTTAVSLRTGLKEAHQEIDDLELILLKRKEILDAEAAKKEVPAQEEAAQE